MEPQDFESRTALVEAGQVGERLDRFVAVTWPEITRSRAKRLILDAFVLVNDEPARVAEKLREGDEVELTLPPPAQLTALPEEIPLDLVYEDEEVLVVNKPAGLVVHPAPGHPGGTLLNALLWHSEELAGAGKSFRPGLVHRLDKDTSGLLMVAKSEQAQAELQRQIQERTASRRYLALLWGSPRWDSTTITASLGRHPTERKRFAVQDNGRHAITELEVLERYGFCSLVEARLQTGRTHQIRIHCLHAGHPVVADPVYGPQAPTKANLGQAQVTFNRLFKALPGQALHAYKLAFNHPRTGQRLEFESSPPAPLAELIAYLRGLSEVRE